MKTIVAAMAALLFLSGGAHAAALQACNLSVDVIDQDPKGTNVRDAPGGRIVALLPSTGPDDWVQVHLLGQAGDWYLIDGATLIGDDEKSVFHGKGYVHRSVIGSYGLDSDAKIYADHNDKSRVLSSSGYDEEDVKFLGCWNDFAKIQWKKITGWTRQLCLNARTTCS